MAHYAIGDIHGCARTLNRLLLRINPGASDTLIFLGDYIDRGPDSKGVIDQLIALPETGAEVICLKGNHEVLLESAIAGESEKSLDIWLRNGGVQTLDSFGLDTSQIQHFPSAYRNWISDCPLSVRKGNWLCAHAGFNLAEEDVLADQHALLWIRNWYDEALWKQRFPDLRAVHGHTPLPRWAIEKAWERGEPVLDLDAGCVYEGRYPGMGWLASLNLDSGILHFEPNAEEC